MEAESVNGIFVEKDGRSYLRRIDKWQTYIFEEHSFFEEKPTKQDIESLKKWARGLAIRFKTLNKDAYDFKDEEQKIEVDSVANPYHIGYIVRTFVRLVIKDKLPQETIVEASVPMPKSLKRRKCNAKRTAKQRRKEDNSTN